MKVISNAMMSQAEIVDTRRWKTGPLELVLLPRRPIPDREDSSRLAVAIYDWNQHHCGGMARNGETMEALSMVLPHIDDKKNPNFILAPAHPNGTTELDTMLASLLPDEAVADLGFERTSANLSLMASGEGIFTPQQAAAVHAAFGCLIWTIIAPKARLDESHFSRSSPLRLLAADPRFWMNRIYRVALERREQLFVPTTHEDPGWKPLEALRAELHATMKPEEWARFVVRRPLMGGTVWDPNDAGDRQDVLQEAINGGGVMASLDPVIELLHTHKAHEDYSDSASWIKEDFERAFHKKRARLKVEVIETLDELPVWSIEENEGYGQVLYRDLFAFLDLKEQRLMLALRSGKTASQIARDSNLRGHASVSRRIAALKSKIHRLIH